MSGTTVQVHNTFAGFVVNNDYFCRLHLVKFERTLMQSSFVHLKMYTAYAPLSPQHNAYISIDIKVVRIRLIANLKYVSTQHQCALSLS